MHARDDGAAAADLSRKLEKATQSADMVDVGDDESPFDRHVNRTAEILGAGILVVFALVVFVNAVGRYAGGYALPWGDELIISLMPWIGMCGLFLSIRRRQVIRIDYFSEKMPRRLRVGAVFFANVVSAAVFAYLAVASFDYLRIFGSDRTLYLGIPSGLFTSALLIGSVGAAIAYGVEARRDLRRGKADAPEETAR